MTCARAEETKMMIGSKEGVERLWTRTPGVKTATCKAISKMNAYNHGARTAWMRQLSALLRRVQETLEEKEG